MLEGVCEERGLGVVAQLGGETVALGRPELFARLGIACGTSPEHDGPIAGLARDGHFLGWMLLADEPRVEARVALDSLRELGLQRQILLTGDHERVARRIGGLLGIPEICAEALPEQKMRRVLAELRHGHKPLVVVDGINDSLALKVGAVGVAMDAQGIDVALASADIVLMTSDLRRLATCIRLSRICRRTIHTNIAAVVHNFSTLAGMANSGRLLRFDETLAGT